MWRQCLFIGFIFLNSCSKLVFAALPNCASKAEVENFVSSPQYLSLYSLNANASKRILNDTEKAIENSSVYAFSVNDFLPNNNNTAYLKRLPPTFCNRSTNAVFHLTLQSLDSIDEAQMTFVLDFWLSIAWYDTRLRYPNEIIRDFISLDIKWLDYFWIPDIIFRNARDVKVLNDIVPNRGLKILRDRVVVWYAKMITTLTCPMSFEKYPHDVQICDMKMESMSYTNDILTFSWDVESPLSVYLGDESLKTPQFKVLKASIRTEECSDPAYNSGTYSCLRVIFPLKRSLKFHMIHSYIPSASVVLLSWITFWIKPEAIAARIGLGVTALLTLVTLNSQSQKDLPPESYAKAIDVWMMSCALFVFGSIIEFAVVNYLVCRFSENAVENIGKSQGTERIFHRIRAVFPNERIQKICHNIDRVSRAFFPFCFISLNIWYWNKHLDSNETS